MKIGLLLAFAVIMAGCVLPEPSTLHSPVIVHRIFIPMWYVPGNPLGIAGCVPSCASLGCSWCYSWRPDPGIGKDHERVPMLWGKGHVGKPIGGNSDWLMGFNEPDLQGQANLTPDEAAVLWRQIEVLYPDRKLVAPAPSDLHPEWIERFVECYWKRYGRSPRMDALAFHCYWTAENCIRLGERFVSLARRWNVPEVWVTEFAFVPAWAPNGDAAGEAQRWLTWLATQPLITRYAPFVSYTRGGEWWWSDTRPEANPSLFKADLRTLTEIGQWYVRRAEYGPWNGE